MYNHINLSVYHVCTEQYYLAIPYPKLNYEGCISHDLICVASNCDINIMHDNNDAVKAIAILSK